MLYKIYRNPEDPDPELRYRGGQGPIVHLEADLHETVDWAEKNARRWAFTLSNAGASSFEDRCDLAHLDEIDWEAVRAWDWRGRKDGKQAEFLVEASFPWALVRRVGVQSETVRRQVLAIVGPASDRPDVAVRQDWYYRGSGEGDG